MFPSLLLPINLTERDENQVQYPTSRCHTAITKKIVIPEFLRSEWFRSFSVQIWFIWIFSRSRSFYGRTYGCAWSFMVFCGHISRSNTAHTSGILSQIFSKILSFSRLCNFDNMSRVSLIGHWKILIGCDTDCRARIINHWPKNQSELVLSHLLIEQVI